METKKAIKKSKVKKQMKAIKQDDEGIKPSGTLYIVGTPIGNLKDITLRAIETLQNVDVVLAEDTRQTLKLLNHLKISKHLVSYHKFNEVDKISNVVELLESGKNVALVSDAGMPIISDPGENLVKYLITEGYNIETIPGVTAITTAIIQSGLDSSRFAFEGFLNTNKKQRKLRLESLVNESRTIIFYEAPHKILNTLKDLYQYLGDRKICIARELTKLYEEYKYLKISEAIELLSNSTIKGEIVLLVEGKSQEDIKNEEIKIIADISNIELVKKYISEGLDKKEAVKKVAKLKNINKNDVYKECLEI